MLACAVVEADNRAHALYNAVCCQITSRMRRKGKRIVHFFDKKYAGSYHTMILLGVDEEGQIVFTDSATRDWAGEQQRLKRAKLPELISYMFPQKNVGDTHLYFSRKRNTGGYILIR